MRRNWRRRDERTHERTGVWQDSRRKMTDDLIEGNRGGWMNGRTYGKEIQI